MAPHSSEHAKAESLPDYEIIDDFDELLEIEETDEVAAGAASEIAQWLREFRYN